MQGPVNLPEFLESLNHRICDMNSRLEEKQRNLDDLMALLKNERNRRKTSEGSLEDCNNKLEELNHSLQRAYNRIWLLEHRTPKDRRWIPDVLTQFSEFSEFHEEDSSLLPVIGSGVIRGEVSCYSSIGATDEFPSPLIVGPFPLKIEQDSTRGLQIPRLYGRNRAKQKSSTDLHREIQEILEHQRQFCELICSESDKAINELEAKLKEFDRLNARLQMLKEQTESNALSEGTAKQECTEGYEQQVLSKTERRLHEGESRLMEVQVELESLRLEQRRHKRSIKHELEVLKDNAAAFERKRKEPERDLLVFSKTDYRLKLARLIWDGMAHFSCKARGNYKDFSTSIE